MSDQQPTPASLASGGETLDGTEPTIFVTHAPFRKDGAPVVGNFGVNVRPVVIMELGVWKRLCAEIPGLAGTKFRVGEL